MNATIIASFRGGVGKAPCHLQAGPRNFRFTRPDDLAAHVVNHPVGSASRKPHRTA